MSTIEDVTRYKAVEDLQEGDLVDLEGDIYADVPDADGECDALLVYEYGVVATVDVEVGTDLIVVEFDNVGVFAFPRGHQVPIGDNS